MKTSTKREDVESKFNDLKKRVAKHESSYNSRAETAKAKIILDDAKKSGKHWVLAWECCNEDYKLSTGAVIKCTHRMPARLTDCYQTYPDKYEARRVGRFKAYRAL